MPPTKDRLSSAFLQDNAVVIGLAVRLILAFALPLLMDDGLLLQGVRYTDIDYDVFTDAADHVAHGRSPYARHTYRYTPFLAKLLALPLEYSGGGGGVDFLLFSTRYFGKILFCVADVVCGYIILVLRRRRRRRTTASGAGANRRAKGGSGEGSSRRKGFVDVSPELVDALWWLYNPLPINICTRGSAESLVVLLPVLATVAVAEMNRILPSWSSVDKRRWRGVLPIATRACVAGILHGIGIHTKLYPVIYTVSFMANFSRQQQQQQMDTLSKKSAKQDPSDVGWRYLLSEQMREWGMPKSNKSSTFPWKHPKQILVLAIFWVQRLLFTISSITFLVVSIGTVSILTYLAVRYHGREALDEGLLYHFVRVDHRHNYSMYWYWIYLARGRAEVPIAHLAAKSAAAPPSAWGYVPLVPQIVVLGFSSLGLAPYDLSFALFCQTFAFVAFNKVVTAQYFTWYLCLLPLCSDRIEWNSKRMRFSFGALAVSIVTWLLAAFSLEMLGWKTHRQVWMASLFFFIANVNLLHSILGGYRKPKKKLNRMCSASPGVGWAIKRKAS